MFRKLLLLLYGFILVYSEGNFKLTQVLILSRHNVRTPLSKTLSDYTPYQWPSWKEKRGYLTSKGALLEGYMGEYMALWLKKEELLPERCPTGDEIYVYANTAQRTMTSAKAFVDNGFPGCNITVHHTSEPSDVIFNPFIHNTTSIFKFEAMEQMKILLKSLHMNQSYIDLEHILNYATSEKCLREHKCDLVNDKNRITVATGTKPNLVGPLKISKSVIDSFIMENYEGFPLQSVAWGRLNTYDDWEAILDLSRGYHNVIFNITLIAQDIAKPLVDYMKDVFIKEKHKVTLLMGHDANIYTVLKSMDTKPYNLNEQYEKIPAGGKIVYQKWLDNSSGIFYSKIDYVYQTTDGMREGRKLSLENPPQITTLELETCKIDENGMCLWDDFVKLLNGL